MKTMMPAIFIGHGSPMNALENNEFTLSWKKLAAEIQRPEAIVCISAHWESKGTKISTSLKPPTIHDFIGFPPELYNLVYPAPGNPELAEEIIGMYDPGEITRDPEAGLDHGCWSILMQMYPDYDIPVIQISLDTDKDGESHFLFARKLLPLRERNILLLGSGNISHNLRMMNPYKRTSGIAEYVEAENKIIEKIKRYEIESLINIARPEPLYQQIIPTREHFLPLLYILACQYDDDSSEIFNRSFVFGSISMTSLKIG